ncbi:type IV pilus assembly protein PilM [Garciella nitratireducens]|uniref:type IV pilus assembly protein PilM n=1 Tax=Garciella nitratireducens TaxID=218205 RepID=UPI000E077741|nr:type IV pilus assembly protein PilM [Garciella nitratireducens]RBP46673.1 type IV pilus assembly protein PilM [Garciella nitratireducens]
MRKKQAVAFDFGSKNIKFAIGKNKDKYFYLDGYEIISTPKDAISNGKIYDKSKISEMLIQFKKRNKIKRHKIMVSISSGETILRIFEIPKMEERELRKAVKFELEHLLPNSIDNYVVDFNILQEYETKIENGERISMIKVQAAVLPKNIVVNYLTSFKDAGLKIDIIDISSNNMLKLFDSKKIDGNLFKDQKSFNKNIAVIDLGNEKTMVTILEFGKVFLNRVIYRGGRDITNIIAQAFKINKEEAEEWKINHNFLTDNSHTEVYNTLKNYLEDFMSELFSIIDYFISRSAEKKLDVIYLIGGGANMKGICKYFENYIHINTQLGNYYITNDYIKTKREIFQKDLLYLSDVIGILLRKE